jgi:hypothetical protein
VLSPAVEIIEKAIQNPCCGVYVHWGATASGKTVALKDMTLIMQSKGYIVKYLDAKDNKGPGIASLQFIDWLRSRIGLYARRYNVDFESFLPKCKAGPTVIVIDHFEDFVWTSSAKAVIKGLCRDALEKETYKIVLSITGWNEAIEVLDWNGGEKIWLAGSSACCGRWDSDGIDAIAALEPRFATLGDEERAEILRLSVLSGSPSAFRDMVHTGPNESRARAVQAEFAEGREKINVYLRSKGWSPV